MDYLSPPICIIALLISIVLFVILVKITKFVYNKIYFSTFFNTSKLLNPLEYFPEEELSSIKQIFYLVLIVLIVVDILYSVVGWNQNIFIFSVFDIILSLYFTIHTDWDCRRNKILLLGLIPLGSMGLLYWGTYYLWLDAFHLMVIAYFIKIYYDKFVEFTETNSLGITIMLLFTIVFVSFLVTIVVEGVSPLDSLVMVSNAFTSNGYAVLGTTALGKANSIFLVWSGFLLSCVGTATLSASIITKHLDKKFDDLEEMAKNKKR